MRFLRRFSDRFLALASLAIAIFALSTWLIRTVDPVPLLAGLGVFLFLTLGALYLLARSHSRRLKRLTLKVEEMAAGNLGLKISDHSGDEVGQLASALTDLADRIKSGVALDVNKHRELQRAKTDFVALASHQLRTPLSIIKWYVDFLLCGDAGALSSDQERYLRQIYLSNERLIELVNALLDVSRIDVGTFAIEPEPMDIVERAESALARFLPEIKAKSIVLIKDYDDFEPINLDPRLTKTVFENILSNSVKYTPSGGTIKVSVKKTDRDAFIRISDSGCGIPREEQPRMFTKLFRADNAKRIESIGTGLGLYIAKAIIEKSGGKIWFHSPSLELLLADGDKSGIPLDKRNRGTTMNITIPLKGMRERHGSKKLSSIDYQAKK
jgi:signal transduction histidine kinase